MSSLYLEGRLAANSVAKRRPSATNDEHSSFAGEAIKEDTDYQRPPYR